METEQVMLQEAAFLANTDLRGKLLEVICWRVKAGTSQRRKQSHSSDSKGEKGSFQINKEEKCFALRLKVLKMKRY